MKNKFALLALLGLFLLGSYTVYAQEANTNKTEKVVQEASDEKSTSFHQIIKQKFN